MMSNESAHPVHMENIDPIRFCKKLSTQLLQDVCAAHHLNEQMHSGLSHSRFVCPLCSVSWFPKIASIVEMRITAASEQVF